jgi:KUP system potassium uptake protein
LLLLVEQRLSLVQHIYIPLVNFWLMVGSLCVAGAYGSDLRSTGSDASLTNAYVPLLRSPPLLTSCSYGFCVSGTLLMTTFLLSLVMLYVSKWHFSIPLIFFLLSGFIDGLFFASSLQKVP